MPLKFLRVFTVKHFPCMVMASLAHQLDSLVPRPYARAHERVWLHKSKSLGPLQNLKASNQIAKRPLLEYCGSDTIYILPCEAPSYGLVCALCFQDLLQWLEVLIYTYCTGSHRQAIELPNIVEWLAGVQLCTLYLLQICQIAVKARKLVGMLYRQF